MSAARRGPVPDAWLDDAVAIATPAGLLLAVADGLGHGELARAASAAVIDAVRAAPDHELAEVLAACGLAVRETRGAVAALARIDPDGRSVALTQLVGTKTA